MNDIEFNLAGERTIAYSSIKGFINDEWIKLRNERITPWIFLLSKGLRTENFYGKTIAYSGVTFEGSPQEVFWGNWIEPFLEDVSIRALEESIRLCREKSLDIKQVLTETSALINILIQNTYNLMSEVDRNLRGKGSPSNIQMKNVKPKVEIMMDFVDERVKSEIASYEKISQFRRIKNNYPFLIWVLPIIIPILFIMLYNHFTNSDPSMRKAVFTELQNARNDLDLSLTAVELNWGYDTKRFKGPLYKEKIPQLFSQELSGEILPLYDSYNSAKISADRIDQLLASNGLDKESIERHKKVIQRTIETFDKVGPKIAEKVGKQWSTPPSNLSQREKWDYLGNYITFSAPSDKTGVNLLLKK